LTMVWPFATLQPTGATAGVRVQCIGVDQDAPE
jgi:hypothetical protein